MAEAMQPRSFFRWKPTAVALWVFAVFFGLIGALDVILGMQVSHGNIREAAVGSSAKLAHAYFRGAAENIAIAALCIVGWGFMRRRTSPEALTVGALAVALSLFITVKRWAAWQMAGNNTLPWLEPLAVWPFFVYAMAYAYRASRWGSEKTEARWENEP